MSVFWNSLLNPVATLIEINSVSKDYRTGLGKSRVHALSDVSMKVKEGEVVAVLGLNGAGKSTLAKVILDLVRPSAGEVLLFSRPVREQKWKGQIGYLPELFAAPKGMNAVQVLRSLGELSGMKGKRLSSRMDEILALLGLTDVADRRIETFSRGMTLRLGIAQALLHEPRLLFLDEPTEGLDPFGRKLIRNLLKSLAGNGITVVLNSHLLSEVELVADRIAILHRGKLVVEGELGKLLPADERFEIQVDTNPALEGWEFENEGAGWSCEVRGSEKLRELLTQLHAHGHQAQVIPRRSTLEEVFFSYLKDP